MTAQNSATLPSTIAVADSPIRGAAPAATRGTLLASLGVIAFSLTFPATAWGLESFGPWSLVALRSVLAAAVAGVFLLALRAPLPARAHWAGLAVV
ncbi:EamA family transporter, partial [Streptomyces xanthophaeus]